MLTLLQLTWDPVIVKPLKVFATLAVVVAIFHIVGMIVLRLDPRLVRAFSACFKYNAVFAAGPTTLPRP